MLAKEGAGTRELADLFSSYTAVRSSPFAMTISKLPRLVGKGRTGIDKRRLERDLQMLTHEILFGITNVLSKVV